MDSDIAHFVARSPVKSVFCLSLSSALALGSVVAAGSVMACSVADVAAMLTILCERTVNLNTNYMTLAMQSGKMGNKPTNLKSQPRKRVQQLSAPTVVVFIQPCV